MYAVEPGAGLVINGSNLSLASCAAGQVLRSNGTSWECAAASAGSLTAGPGLTIAGSVIDLKACASGQVLKHNGTQWACAADSEGGLAGSGTAATAAHSDHTHGVLFTRWGQPTCPAASTLVYAGFAAGGAYNQTGSGANTLCLTDAPGWNAPDGTLLAFSDLNQNGALMYGTEFETATYGVGPLGAVQNYDARCAVCLAPASVTMVYPGAPKCPSGWTTQYYGYLMASHYTQNKSEFVCVDVAPAQAGSNADNNGNLWYPTEAECGSLPCGTGQYVQDRELTCAMCTR